MASSDPKTMNQNFAAFFAKRGGGNKKELLKKNDTNGMILYGMIDSVRRMPAKRSPGSFYITVFSDKCKIFDKGMFCTDDDGTIIISANEDNPEERRISNGSTLICGTFDVPEGFDQMAGKLVKCHGFVRNSAG